jgi:hypothetical protein
MHDLLYKQYVLFPMRQLDPEDLVCCWRLLVHVVLLTELSLLMSWGELLVEAARNNFCVIAIVGYHSNVYRVVASIPIWVTVTSLPIWVTCGRFPWKVPTECSRTPGCQATIILNWESWSCRWRVDKITSSLSWSHSTWLLSVGLFKGKSICATSTVLY